MPIEIRELIIRAVATDDTERPSDASSEGSSGAVDQERIVEECVRQVLAILRRRGER